MSPPVPSARQVALDLLGAVLRRKRPLDDAIEDNPDMPSLSVRDRAFARLLVATVLRRLGVEGPERVERQDAARLNTPEWLWRSWSAAYGDDMARAIATAHLKEA